MPENTQGQFDVASWLKSRVMDNGFNLNPAALNRHYSGLFGSTPGQAAQPAPAPSPMPNQPMPSQQQPTSGNMPPMFPDGMAQQQPMQQPFAPPQQSNPMPQSNAYAQHQPFRRPLSSYLGDTPSMLMQGNPYARGFGQ